MDIEPVIERDRRMRILSAFESGSPTGEDLRLDTTPQSLYFRLRDARSQARADERVADSDPEAASSVPVCWQSVQALAIEALESRTKDVEIAVWLTESLARYDGLPGLAEAVTIIAGLIEQFWDDSLYPTPDETDPEGRLMAISGLSGIDRDGSLLQPLQKTVLLHMHDGRPLSFWEYERSGQIAAARESSAEKEVPASDLPDFNAIETVASGAGQTELRQVGEHVSSAIAAWRQLETVLERVASENEMPSTRRVSATLERLQTIIERHVRIDPPTPEAGPLGTGAGAASADEAAAGLPSTAAAVTREELLDQVTALARAFRSLEPNSPISYTLEEAVRRANLTWPDLMRELVSEPPQLATILSSVGLRPPAEPRNDHEF